MIFFPFIFIAFVLKRRQHFIIWDMMTLIGFVFRFAATSDVSLWQCGNGENTFRTQLTVGNIIIFSYGETELISMIMNSNGVNSENVHWLQFNSDPLINFQSTNDLIISLCARQKRDKLIEIFMESYTKLIIKKIRKMNN